LLSINFYKFIYFFLNFFIVQNRQREKTLLVYPYARSNSTTSPNAIFSLIPTDTYCFEASNI